MSGNDRIEVEREDAVERLRPVEEAAALRVVDVDVHAGRPRPRRCRSGPRAPSPGLTPKKEVACVNRLQLGEVDDGVAVRMTAAEVLRACFPA